MIERIYLDLDEVLVDFVGGFSEAYDYDFTGIDGWDMAAHVGISGDHFYRLLNNLGHEFWANLEQHSWKDHLVELVEGYADEVYIVSTPSLNPGAWSGKMEWVKQNLPSRYTGKLILTADKHLLAKDTALLIDDKQSNVDNFKNYGGFAVAFPQLWNDADEFVDSRIPYIKSYLDHHVKL